MLQRFESNETYNFCYSLKVQDAGGGGGEILLPSPPPTPRFRTLSVGQGDNSFKFRPFRLFQAEYIFFSKKVPETSKKLVIRTL